MKMLPVAGAAATFLPLLASAETLFDTLTKVSSFVNALIGLFITAAIVVFFWGLIMYLTKAEEEGAKGLNLMIWGVVAIFVMVSIWGIIRLLQSTFNVSSTAPIIPSGIQIQRQ